MRWIFLAAPLLCFSGGTSHADPFGVPAPLLIQQRTVAPAAASNCGVSGPWTCVAHTQLAPTGSGGGTTAALNCTGSNMIVAVAQSFSGGPTPTMTDSQSNTYGTPTFTSSALITGWVLSSPTVGASQTFTVSGTSSFSTLSVECWHDTSGTPAYEGAGSEFNQAGTATTASGFAYTTTHANDIVFGAITSNGTGTTVYTADTGYTVLDQIPPVSGQNVSGGLAYKLIPTTQSNTFTWTLTPPSTVSTGTIMFAVSP